MKARPNIGFAILLATLLLLSASGLCAAVMTLPSTAAHPCCPPPPTSASSPNCCGMTGAPAVPFAVTVPGPTEEADLAPSEFPFDLSAYSHSEAVVATQTSFPHPHLFICFHQFLI
jgi:hypothetical protein